MAAMPAPDRSEPSASPSLTGALGTGWETLKQRFWLLIVAVLIYGAIEAASNVFTVPVGPGGPQQPVSVIGPLWSILVTGPLLVGLAWLALRAVRGLEPELDDLFEGFRHYPDAVGGMLVYGLAVTVGLILLVVPGLIAMVRLAFTPYLIVDRELGPHRGGEGQLGSHARARLVAVRAAGRLRVHPRRRLAVARRRPHPGDRLGRDLVGGLLRRRGCARGPGPASAQPGRSGPDVRAQRSAVGRGPDSASLLGRVGDRSGLIEGELASGASAGPAVGVHVAGRVQVGDVRGALVVGIGSRPPG
jgi:hypothetical protein